MFCRSCGKELAGAPEICVNCGAKPMAGTSFCSKCGAPTTPMTEICTNCGARVSKAIKGKTWKPTAAGILCIIVGAVVVVISGMVFALFVGPATTSEEPIGVIILIFVLIPLILLGIVAIVGGIYALRRNIWGLALVGSISALNCGIITNYIVLGWLSPVSSSSLLVVLSVVVFGLLGLLALTFVVLGKGEFKAKALAGDISPKSRLATTLLAFVLGVFGAHRFYIGKPRTAIVMLFLGIAGWAAIWAGIWFFASWYVFFTAVGFGIAVGTWAFVDFVVAVTGDMTDKEGRLIKKW